MWLEIHGMVAEHDGQGKPIRLMGTLADIGERKRIEEEGARAREMAEKASQAKSEFLANISHEVRTPLNAIMGLTRMLIETPLNAEQANWLSLMDTSAHSLLALLNDILDLSRIEAGKLDIEHTRFDPAPHAARCGRPLRRAGPGQTAELPARAAPGPAAMGHGRPGTPGSGGGQSALQRDQVHAAQRPHRRHSVQPEALW